MRNEFKRKTITNKLAVTGLICCILGTAGCVSNGKSYLEEECENGICTSNREFTDVCVENADGYSECRDSGNINYTRGAADFREYGERLPRDHRITQAGAGNNISAAIPPSIDNEVVAYENGAVNDGYGQPWNPAAYPQGATMSAQNKGAPYQSGNGAAMTNNGQYVGNAPMGGQLPQNGGQYTGTQNGQMQQAGVKNTNKNTNNDDESASEEESSTSKDWLAEEGQSLKELLTMWSDEAGWRLIWKTNRNYTLNAGAMFRGNFADVASALIRAFARARPAPIATFYKGNRVLVVETMEDENAYD